MVVNVPGALTWNELATKDIPGAKEFYGPLFGWEFQDMDTGGGPLLIICNATARTAAS
jgi:predicted enzyme related to lactoylglutathione lyase